MQEKSNAENAVSTMGDAELWALLKDPLQGTEAAKPRWS